MTHEDNILNLQENAVIPEFRELPSEQLWTATTILEGVSQQQFAEILKDIYQRTGFNFFGFFVEKKDKSVEYHFSRYPRHKYGIPTLEQCQAAADELKKGLEISNSANTVRVDDFVDDKQKGIEFRVLLGLLEGYDKDQIIHNKDEVAEIIGSSVGLQSATIYSVGKNGEYTEPAVWIKGKKDDLPKVYEIANSFKQERFTIENLAEEKAHVVEPPCCISSDPPVRI